MSRSIFGCRLAFVAGLACLAFATPARAADCPGADDRLAPGGETAFGAALACVVRDARGDAVRVDPNLSSAADRHARDMVARGYFEHVSPSGSRLVDRLRRAGWLPRHRDWEAGEVQEWATSTIATPAGLLRGWLASPPHRRVLLDRGFDEIGVGLQMGTPSDGPDGITAVLDFGHRASARSARG